MQKKWKWLSSIHALKSVWTAKMTLLVVIAITIVIIFSILKRQKIREELGVQN